MAVKTNAQPHDSLFSSNAIQVIQPEAMQTTSLNKLKNPYGNPLVVAKNRNPAEAMARMFFRLFMILFYFFGNTTTPNKGTNLPTQ